MPVLKSHRIARLGQGLAHGLGHGHGTVAASRAAEGHGEAVAPLVLHEGQKEEEQIQKLGAELPGLGRGEDIVGDLGILAAACSELGDEVGIGQEAQVEDVVGFSRNAVLEAEGEDVDAQCPEAALGRAESPLDDAAQIVDGKAGGVDHHVGGAAQACQPGALQMDRALQAYAFALQRMGAPGGHVAAHDLGRVGFEEHKLGAVAGVAQGCQGVLDLVEEARLAYVEAEHYALEVGHGGLFHELDHLGRHAGRQAVDGEIAQILEDLHGRALARTGKAGHDADAPGRGSGFGPDSAARFVRFGSLGDVRQPVRR